MGLHAITDTELHFHCPNPSCKYHNCAAWEDFLECASHDTPQPVVIPKADAVRLLQGKVAKEVLDAMGDLVLQEKVRDRVSGETRVVPINHPEIQYTDHDLVALPQCECGTRTFVKVKFTDAELQAPNIKVVVRDPANPLNVKEVKQHPMVARHQALHEKLQSMGRVHTPAF